MEAMLPQDQSAHAYNLFISFFIQNNGAKGAIGHHQSMPPMPDQLFLLKYIKCNASREMSHLGICGLI